MLFLEKIINFFGYLYVIIRPFNAFLGNMLSILVMYRIVYKIVGLFFTRKFKPAKKVS